LERAKTNTGLGRITNILNAENQKQTVGATR
jgi:hypothetical protein